MLKIGNAAPAFNALNENGEEVSRAGLLGKKYILFFYGQDDTPTCTKQVCAANDVWKQVTKAGYQIFGVSPDSVKKHKKFADKYQLQLHLLSDPEKKMMYDFEAYGPKIFMGKEVIGVYRKAYFIDMKGKIENILTDVVSADQGKLIVEILES